jgi:hypothetical protein
MGRPEHIEYFPVADDEPGISEHWAYARPDGYWLFYFVPGIPAIDYLLQESFGPLATPGNDYFQRFVTGSALDPIYSKRLAFGSLSPGERRMALRQVELQAREFQRRVVTGVPDAPEIRPTVRLVVEPLWFWNPGIDTFTVWMLASAQVGDLSINREGGVDHYSLSARLTLGVPGGVRIAEVSRDVGVSKQLSDQDGIDLAIASTVPAGSHPFTLSITDSQSPQSGGNWLQDTLVVPDLSHSLPAVSDIAVARDSGGTWSRDGVSFLKLSPVHATNADGSIFVYFEVYGMFAGSPYTVDVRLVLQDEAERAYDIQEDDPAFSLLFASEMPAAPSPIGAHQLRLDLGSTESGTYLLLVRVTDLGRSIVSLPSTTTLTVR